MSSSDKKEKPPGRATPSFDPAMTKTLPLGGTVASPFGPPAPEAPGFGVEDTRKALEKSEKARTPAGHLEKTEVMSPEERKHGRPSRPKKADSPSKVAKADSPSKIAKGDSPSKIAKRRSPSKTTKLKAPPRYPGLVETTERMPHAKRKPSRGKAFDPRQMRTEVLAPAEPAKVAQPARPAGVIPEPELLKAPPRVP
ncbi:MAG TPA: hypothetical protein VIY73_12160, partial [Polyangiaceae bacterium]